jgi:hypothetical protein
MSSKQCFITRIVPHSRAHYVSSVEPRRLMLFKQTVAVYCENFTKHMKTLCGHHEPPSVSTTDGVHFMGSLERSFLKIKIQQSNYSLVHHVSCKHPKNVSPTGANHALDWDGRKKVKHHSMKVYGSWRYSCMHSKPLYCIWVASCLHTVAAAIR